MRSRGYIDNQRAKKLVLRFVRILGLIALLFFGMITLYNSGIKQDQEQKKRLDCNATISYKNVFKQIKLNQYNSVEGVGKGEQVTLNFTLPELEDNLDTIIEFKSGFCGVTMEAYLGDQWYSMIYDTNAGYGQVASKESSVMHSKGSAIYAVAINHYFSGCKARIIFDVQADNSFNYVPDIYVSDGFAAYRSIIAQKLFKIVISFLMLVIGCAIIVFFIFDRNFGADNRRHLWLGIAFVSGATWILTVNGVMQLVTPYFRYYNTIEYMALALYFFCLAIYSVDSSSKRFVRNYGMVVSTIMMLYTCIMLVLDATNIVSMHANLIYLHYLLLFTFIVVIMYCVEEIMDKHKYGMFIVIGVFVTFFVFMKETISYNGRLSKYDFGSGNIPYAMAFLLIAFVADHVSDLARYYSVKSEKEVLKRLAYEDVLTGLANRNACEIELEKCEKASKEEQFVVMMIDVNNLKFINDNYGHKAGDAIIKNMGRAIQYATESMKCFTGRFGGDEFLIIMECDIYIERNIEKLIDNLNKEVFKINRDEKNKYELMYAHGYTIFSPGRNSNIWNSLKLADERMYEMKKNRNK